MSRLWARLLVGLVVAGSVAGSFLLGPVTAARASSCLPSGGCATVHYVGDLTGSRAAQLHMSWRVVVTGTDVAGASVYLTAQPGLMPLLSSVTVNGTPVTATQPLPGRTDLEVTLPGLPVATVPVSFVVSYTVAVDPAAPAVVGPGADLSFSDAGSAHTRLSSTNVWLPVAFPDLVTSTTGSELWVPRGHDVSLFFGITNYAGQVDPTAVGLDISLPAGFHLGSVQGHGISQCHPTGVRQTHCTLAYQPPFFTSALDVYADSSAATGTTGQAILTAEPLGTPPDMHPADNTHRMTLHVRGIANVTERWMGPAGGTVAVGQPTAVSVTFTNHGPDAITYLGGVAVAKQNSDVRHPDFRVSATTARGDGLFGLGFTSLAPGESHTLSFTVTGLRVGAQLELSTSMYEPSFAATSGAGEVIGSHNTLSADSATSTRLTVITALPASETLPATGAGGAGATALTGLAFLLAGLILLQLGRRLASDPVADSTE